MLNASHPNTEGSARRAPRPRDVVVLIWAGVTAVQAYRAANVCVSVSAATTVYFGLLATTVLVALFLARRAWLFSADTAPMNRADAIAPVVVLCVGVTLAMRLIELCSGQRLVP